MEGADAVDGEGDERPGLEVANQEADREQGGTAADRQAAAACPRTPSLAPGSALPRRCARQRHVLDQLVDNHVLQPARAGAIFHEPLPLPRKSAGRAPTGQPPGIPR